MRVIYTLHTKQMFFLLKNALKPDASLYNATYLTLFSQQNPTKHWTGGCTPETYGYAIISE